MGGICNKVVETEGCAVDEREWQGHGILTVTWEALAQALHLPHNVEIIDIGCEMQDRWDRMVRLVLRGPGLPYTQQGERLPLLVARYQRDEHGAVMLDSIRPV